MAKKGALAKDPKKTTTPSAPTRPENKAIFDAMTPDQQARYTKVRANKGLEAANKYAQSATGKQMTGPGGRARTPEEKRGTVAPVGPSNEPAPGTPFGQLTPEQQGQEMADVGGEVFTRMGGFANQFDPRAFQQQYEGGFGQEMDRYRQNYMNQFERRNQRQFEQQRLGVQQMIAERGLDPASPAAQELVRMQNEREDVARQEAMSAAEQGAYGVQQQAFGQAKDTALLPAQIAQGFMEPSMAGYLQAGAMNLQQLQGQQAMEQQRLQGRQALQQIKATPRGGGGGGGPQVSPYDILERNSLFASQPQQPNPWAQGASSFVGSFGQGLGQQLGQSLGTRGGS